MLIVHYFRNVTLVLYYFLNDFLSLIVHFVNSYFLYLCKN